MCAFDAQIDFFVDLSWKYIKLAILGDPEFLDQILGVFGPKMLPKSPKIPKIELFLEHGHVIYRWKAFLKLISMVIIKMHNYALWVVNYAHKLCIIRPKMTQK